MKRYESTDGINWKKPFIASPTPEQKEILDQFADPADTEAVAALEAQKKEVMDAINAQFAMVDCNAEETAEATTLFNTYKYEEEEGKTYQLLSASVKIGVDVLSQNPVHYITINYRVNNLHERIVLSKVIEPVEE